MNTVEELDRYQPRRSVSSFLLCGFLLGVTLLIRLFLLRTTGPQGLSLFADDFFYYSKIAVNLASGHGSTFNGIVKTNGYHPLWMLVIVLLTKFTSSTSEFLLSVEVVIALSVFATYSIARRTLRLFIGNPWVASVISLFISLRCLGPELGGMEIALTIPLGMLFLHCTLNSMSDWTLRRASVLSFLASLLILSRLDSIILVALVGFAFLTDIRIRRSLNVKYLMAILLGFLPLFFYLALNEIFFGNLLPISGAAKQLRSSYSISWLAWYSIEKFTFTQRQGLPILLCIASLAWLFVVRHRLAGARRQVFIAALVFPIVQLLIVSELSDWPLWPWYFYSSLIPLGVALGILLGDATSPFQGYRRIRWFVGGVVGISCLYTMISTVRISVRDRREAVVVSRVKAAVFISRFAESHPGRYAMGDRAGVVGQVLQEPIIQTEGLVMDKNFLIHIRQREDLLPVLQSYDVRYYVASVRPPVAIDPCLRVVEPAQAGPTAPRMTAQICVPPEATHNEPDYVTLIYDLSKIK